ncbi:receptor-like protein EIX2 isoform X2 [Trifolium pratense]|uniref:receptor-like protein EIX2 isoform X2 n=1 Tax=Trifolium pratense TaxID=57577 RepID=UPI001E694FA3|nr:receptor-like protein EIX2 isoform X2 [Trifolium pratense]
MMMMMMRSVVCINLKLVGAIFVLLHFNLLFSNYSVVAVADTKHVVSISGGCIENERHALLELKASLVLDDTSLLPTWDSKSHDCCAWEGIVCSNQTRHVKMLDLNGDQFGPFRGEINASLMELQHLKHLDVSGSEFSHGIFRKMFGSLSNLIFLDLKSSSITGRIPNDLGQLSHLQYLDLSNNDLEGTIPHQLGNLSHLQYLDLSGNILVGTIPHQLGSLSNLQELNLGFNQLNVGGTIPNLPIRFSEDCQVIMDSNQFEGSIPPFFQSASLLQLSKNKFSDTFLLLCSNISIDRLLVLDLSKNQLSRKLPDCWSHLKDLEFIDLSDNTLSGEVPSSMGSMVKLKVLILRNNSLYGKLPVSLKNCKKLNMLDIGDNRFFGPIPYWLGQQLQMLSLRRNQFNGSLPQSLCDLKNIQLLDLSENNLSGQIFKCIKNFSAMSQNVSPNGEEDYNFGYPTGDEFEHIYTGYDLVALLMWKGSERQFKNNKLILRSIDLSSNQLIGDLPEEIGNLIELVSLNLSSNNFTGEITSKIGRLTSLEFLDLSRNLFSGPIPPSLVQIDRLSMLNLSENNLSGRIPIGTQLQSFDASSYEGNNDLCGKPLDKICPGDEEGAHQKPETHKESSHEDKKPLYLSVALGFITGFWGLWGSLFLIRHWRHKYVLFLDNIIDTMYVFIVLNATKFQVWLRHLQEKFV